MRKKRLRCTLSILKKFQKRQKNSQKSIDKAWKKVYNYSRLAYANQKKRKKETVMNLLSAELGKEYIINAIETDDEELDAFLFSLGCYSGEPITVVSRRKGSCVVSIKDGRYSIDNQLAEAIII
jgi:ferrous iron transport protein A